MLLFHNLVSFFSQTLFFILKFGQDVELSSRFKEKFKSCFKNASQECMFCRSSFDSSVPQSKKKAQTEGEDTEEDVEEQKVSMLTLQKAIITSVVIYAIVSQSLSHRELMQFRT